MGLEKANNWLVAVVGQIAAKLICCLLLWVLIGIIVRTYTWINGSISGGVDPVKFAMGAFITWIAFTAWRFFADNNLDD